LGGVVLEEDLDLWHAVLVRNRPIRRGKRFRWLMQKAYLIFQKYKHLKKNKEI